MSTIAGDTAAAEACGLPLLTGAAVPAEFTDGRETDVSIAWVRDSTWDPPTPTTAARPRAPTAAAATSLGRWWTSVGSTGNGSAGNDSAGDCSAGYSSGWSGPTGTASHSSGKACGDGGGKGRASCSGRSVSELSCSAASTGVS